MLTAGGGARLRARLRWPAYLGLSLVLPVTLLGGCGPDRTQTASQISRPNILVVIADDWSRPHAGAYGDPAVLTPAFDRVAREGVLFQNAFVSAPSCTPSRAALLTGQFHWRLEESANLWSTLQASIPVYPDILEETGYFVGFTLKGWGPGRHEVGGRSRNPAGNQFRHFDQFLEQRPNSQPFCFWFGSFDPHRPYDEGSWQPAGLNPDRVEVPPHLPDDPVVRHDIADYLAEVERFDRALDRLLRRLEEVGEAGDTMVVVTSDNGMPFPRCKANLYDCGARVPLAIRWPARVSPGRRVEQFVSLTDLAPTFLEAAGLPVPAVMTGRSLLPILLGEKDATDRSYVLSGKERHTPCQETGNPGGTPMRAIRTKEFLYVRNFHPERWPAGTPDYQNAFIPGAWYADVDNGPTKLLMIERREAGEPWKRLYELSFAHRPAEELYDLAQDPAQLRNVAQDPEYAAIRAELATRLEEELRRTGDPRLSSDPDQLERFPYYGHGPRYPGWKASEPQ